MELNNADATESQEPQEGQEATPEGREQNPASGEAEGQSQEGESTQEEKNPEGESPLWEGIPEDHPVRAEVERLRKESAAKRTTAQQIKQENEELKAKLAEAKSAEEVSELIEDWQSKVSQAELAATRERIGRRHSLPDEVVELLKGSDEESLEQHAQKLKELFGSSRPTPPTPPARGGKSPGDETGDPRSYLAAIKKNRR